MICVTGNSRIALVTNVATSGTTTAATGEVDERQSIIYGRNDALNSVWYSWNATVTQRVFLSIPSSDYDTVFEVYKNPRNGIRYLQVCDRAPTFAAGAAVCQGTTANVVG